MALVSVIIPYIGKKSFIQKTLTSVLNQTFQDIEIILIEAALEKSSGQVSQASEILKLRRTTLIEKMIKLAIEKPNY